MIIDISIAGRKLFSGYLGWNDILHKLIDERHAPVNQIAGDDIAFANALFDKWRDIIGAVVRPLSTSKMIVPATAHTVTLLDESYPLETETSSHTVQLLVTVADEVIVEGMSFLWNGLPSRMDGELNAVLEEEVAFDRSEEELRAEINKILHRSPTGALMWQMATLRVSTKDGLISKLDTIQNVPVKNLYDYVVLMYGEELADLLFKSGQYCVPEVGARAELAEFGKRSISFTVQPIAIQFTPSCAYPTVRYFAYDAINPEHFADDVGNLDSVISKLAGGLCIPYVLSDACDPEMLTQLQSNGKYQGEFYTLLVSPTGR